MRDTERPDLPGLAAKWHQAVPRDPQANVEWRRDLWGLCDTSAAIRAAAGRRSREDILYWTNAFVWLFDPDAPATIPFATWPYQDVAIREMVQAVIEGYDLLVEKSRDMGASWMVLIVYLWLWLWHGDMALLAISRIEDLVDRPGDPDTLFWKFRFARDHLPTWMIPSCRDASLHAENLSNGSVFDGRATSQDAARAGRRKSLLIDEHASIEHAQAVETATADVAKCRIRISTPKGMNTFGKLRHSGKVKVLTLHWSSHPIKARGLYTSEGGKVKLLDAYRGTVKTFRINSDSQEIEQETHQYPDAYPFMLDGRTRSPWYDGECVRRGSEIEVAQELDIDYLRSGHLWYDAAVVQRLKRTTVRKPEQCGDLAFTLTPDDRIEVRQFLEAHVGMLRLWCMLDPDGRPAQAANYAVGCDIAEGTGASNSVASVYDCTGGRKVAELVTPHQTPEAFARTVVALCQWFGGGTGEPFLMWEQNGPGLIFGKEIQRLGYGYVYYQRHEEAVHRDRHEMRVAGWPATRVNKQLLHGDYRRDLSLGQFLNPSAQAVAELLEYIVDQDGSPLHEKLADEPSGARLAHGDRVVADALVNLARKEQSHYRAPERPIPASSYFGRRQVALAKQRRED